MNYSKMLQWIGTHHVGVSSRTMWCALMGVANCETPAYCGFDVPHDRDDFSRCYNLVTFCEVEKEELQRVVEAFPYYKPIVDEWDNLVAAYLDKSGCSRSVFQIIDSRRDEIMALKGYTKKGYGYWVKKTNPRTDETMKLRDLRIGDVVQAVSMHGIASPPMTVVAIFAELDDLKDPKSRAGTVYLDFEGNEGDVWEEDIADLIPYVADET